jgi:hypothetical protein
MKKLQSNANKTWIAREVTRQWGQYTPGLELTFPKNYYQPINEWKIIPEEMPLMWISPIWCFFAGLLALYGSYTRRRDSLLNVSCPNEPLFFFPMSNF